MAGCGFVVGNELLVTFARGDSASRDEVGGMFCSANIVADCGVFSPKMLCGGFLVEERAMELMLSGMGMGAGAPGTLFSFSSDLASLSYSLPRFGVDGLADLSFSGEPRGVELAESRSLEPSIIKLRSLTLPG